MSAASSEQFLALKRFLDSTVGYSRTITHQEPVVPLPTTKNQEPMDEVQTQRWEEEQGQTFTAQYDYIDQISYLCGSWSLNRLFVQFLLSSISLNLVSVSWSSFSWTLYTFCSCGSNAWEHQVMDWGTTVPERSAVIIIFKDNALCSVGVSLL